MKTPPKHTLYTQEDSKRYSLFVVRLLFNLPPVCMGIVAFVWAYKYTQNTFVAFCIVILSFIAGIMKATLMDANTTTTRNDGD